MTDNSIIDDDDDEVSKEKDNSIDWTPQHEEILIEWADKAMCYRWLHSKAHAMFASLNTWYTIPVIVISTLTGTANFAQERVPIQYQSLFVMIVGGFNILAGIITTIQQFLKITQLNEAHRVSSIAWDKFYRNIKIELAKHPEERIDVRQMIKMSKEEFDRLMETSPTIPEKIVGQFKSNFNSQMSFGKIVKPEICDILIPTSDNRNPWFNEENITKTLNDKVNLQMAKASRLKKNNQTNNKIFSEFTSLFYNLNNRQPMESEIIDNLKDKIEISILKKIIENSKSINLSINLDDNSSVGDIV